MKTCRLIKSQPLPKLSLIFNANRRSLLREPISILAPWKKLNVRGRT